MKMNLDFIYPVGSIYMSANTTNPSVLFGGTWTQLKDRFLLGAGDTYAVGTTGGEATHKLTVNEMPSHKHNMDEDAYGGGGFLNRLGIRQDGGGGTHSVPAYAQTNSFSTYVPQATGGSQPHNNMPPYLVVYMWKRTA